MRYASGTRRPMNRVDRPFVGDSLCRKVGAACGMQPVDDLISQYEHDVGGWTAALPSGSRGTAVNNVRPTNSSVSATQEVEETGTPIVKLSKPALQLSGLLFSSSGRWTRPRST
jgi:hypothetical protein